MSKFALELIQIEAVKGKQRFDKLVINGKCPFDEFEESMRTHYANEMVQLYALMNEVANLRSLPNTKFHAYDKNDPRGWEFKTKNLRLYCVEQPGGKIVVIGGQKSLQNKDTSVFRHYQSLLHDWNKSNKST